MVELCSRCGKNMDLALDGPIFTEWRCNCGHGKILYHAVERLSAKGGLNGGSK
jgi:DNA-directed RNA polymerase subunit RPC12/RpoP